MKVVSKISSGQFFSLLLLSRMLSTLTFMPIAANNFGNSDYIISVIIGSLLIPVFCLPLYFFYRKGTSENIIDKAYNISPIFSKIIAVLYVTVFLYYAFSTLARMDLFVGTVVFPDNDTTFFIIISIIAVCYAASKGLEPLGRVGVISLFLFCASLLAIFITLVDEIDMNNLSPFFYDGSAPIAKTAWSVVIRTVEPAAIAILLPRVTGNIKKGAIICIAAFALILTTIFFFMMAVVGDFSLLHMFPVQSMAVLAEFSVFERLDVLLTGVWIISAFIKISFMIYLLSEILSVSFKKEWKNHYIVVTGLVLAVAAMLESKSITFFPITTSSAVRGVLFVLFIVVLPSVVIISNLISKRKTE